MTSKKILSIAARSLALRPTLQPANLPDGVGGDCGRWLRSMREQHGLTLRAIAEASEGTLTKECLRQIETRGSAPGLGTFVALCKTLDADPCAILGQLTGDKYTAEAVERRAAKVKALVKAQTAFDPGYVGVAL
jgi:transcriptional regulator with XRE-family HTH domain